MQTKFKVGEKVKYFSKDDNSLYYGIVADVPNSYKDSSWANDPDKVWAFWDNESSATWAPLSEVVSVQDSQSSPPTPTPDMVVKYKHIRPQADKAKSGGMTIAYGLKHKPNGGRELHVGISYCNKGDHFNKAIGRGLALKALETKPSVFEFDLLVANLLPGYNKVKPMRLINYLFAPIEENGHE